MRPVPHTCPESVITLEPRYNFTDDARRELILNKEDPFECVACGKPFGVRSSIEAMIEKLKDHSMFANDPKALDRLRMCEDCRVVVAFETVNPMAAGERPRTRTTDDYLNERDDD